MNPNSFWYLGLVVISLIILIYSYLNNARSLLLTLVLVECIYLFETVIYVFFESYQYYPKLLPHDEYFDSNIGALVSNSLTVPSLATAIATFDLGWKWIFTFIGFLSGIEWLFLKLHIYTHNWWRIEYTALGLLALFLLAKVLFRLIMRPLTGYLYWLFLLLSIAPLAGTMQIVTIMLFANSYYLPGWFENPSHDTTAFTSIYYLGVSILVVGTIKLRWKYEWLKYVFISSVMFAATLVLKDAAILKSMVWWDTPYTMLCPCILLKIAEKLGGKLSDGPG